jgi:hypothetical protein
MKPEPRMDTSALGTGIFLIVAGIALTLAKLDLLRLEGLGALWPLVVVAAGLWVLATGAKPKKRRRGAVMIVVGAWLLVNTLELFDLSWYNSWPALMILLGLLQLVWPDEKEGRLGGLTLMAVGGWMLLTVTHTFGLDWSNAWPGLMVIAGLSLILKSLVKAMPALLGGRS